MSLAEILKEIKSVQVFANEDVESGAPETLVGRRGRKAQSIERLKQLKTAYRNELRSTAAFIIVIGDKRDEFTSVAIEGYKCFNADPESFYSDLVDRVPKSSYLGKEGLHNLFDILGRHLEDKALELDIIGYPQLIFRQEYRKSLNTREDFLSVVKKAVTEQVGGEVVGLQAVKTLTDVAIERNNTAKMTPILLPTGDETFGLTVARDLERISNRVFVVVAGETSLQVSNEEALVVKEPTNEGVKKALRTISNSLRK